MSGNDRQRATTGPATGSAAGAHKGTDPETAHQSPPEAPHQTDPETALQPGRRPAPRTDGRADLRARYDAATGHLDPPLAIVDLDAFDANAADLVRRAAGKPIRLASKSVRCRALLQRALARDGFAGIMAFTLPEALWLAAEGVSDDILVAYPTTDRAALTRLAADPQAAARVTLMVDSVDHLDLIERVLTSSAVSSGDAPDGEPHSIRLCLDIDTSWHAAGGRVRIGARRSPVRTPAQAAALAAEIRARPRMRLVGLMAYEAQVAGVGDTPPGKPLMGLAIRFIKRRSLEDLAERRARIVEAVRAEAPDLAFVNGGGTGSVEQTAAEDAVTEIAAGSGLYHSVLFDHYSNFRGRPAAAFALPVVRRPAPRVVTVLGGGYLASGPADRSRLPLPYLPEGLHYDPREGAGEVQTPLLGRAADRLAVGDRVWFRHAKAGELCERFAEVHLVAGEEVVGTVPTYRGEGKTFL